jgi:hypothetical protein
MPAVAPAPVHPTTAPPPRSLVNLSAARRRFGAARVDVLIDLAMTGDPLADGVIAEMSAQGPVAVSALAAWKTSGAWPSPVTLSALHALLADLTPRPELDWAQVERGASAYRAAGALWTMLALGPGSLVHTYLAPVPASVQVQTVNLVTSARQRVIETGTWLIATLLPGGLRPGGAGVVHTLEVRLLHARVRAALLARGWDTAANGLPLNQLEMTRTWLDFTVVPFTALARLGLPFTRAELTDLYALWQVIGHLLGVDQRLIAAVHDQRSATELLALIDMTMAPPSADSRTLTAAMITAIAELAAPSLGRLGPHAQGLSVALARRIHGRHVAAMLGIPRTWVSLLVPIVVAGHRLGRAWGRRSDRSWQAVCDRGTQSFRDAAAQVVGLAAYQQAAAAPVDSQFPQVQDPAG